MEQFPYWYQESSKRAEKLQSVTSQDTNVEKFKGQRRFDKTRA